MLPTLIGDHPAAAVDRPLLTYCDDATGERLDLTAAELGNWAARTAGLLREGCRLDSGDEAAVLLPPHWQTAAILLGAWSMGIAVSYRPWATAGLPGTDTPADVLFVTRQRLESWLEAVPEARHRFVAGDSAGDVPAGYRHYVTEARRYPGSLPAYGSIRRTDQASPDGTTYRQWGEVARGIAESLGLRPGDRVLVDAAHTEQPVTWLLAPLAAGASVLLCANLDRANLDERIAAEGVTHVL